MKRKNIFDMLLGCLLLSSCTHLKSAFHLNRGESMPVDDTSTWKVVFDDEFNSGQGLDTSKWAFCTRGKAAWARYLTSGWDYAYQDRKHLILKMDNHLVSGDSIPYHSTGIQTLGKFSFTYGGVEVRAKFNQGEGSWPAIWMMPEKSCFGAWPNSGEIDIMEHVNYLPTISQTIYNGFVTQPDGGSTATHTAVYNINEYNTYGMIWEPGSIQFYVNGKLQYTHSKKVNATSKDWPFDKPFYLIVNQSGGAGWPGAIAETDLPFTMQLDWIRVYQKK